MTTQPSTRVTESAPGKMALAQILYTYTCVNASTAIDNTSACEAFLEARHSRDRAHGPLSKGWNQIGGKWTCKACQRITCAKCVATADGPTFEERQHKKTASGWRKRRLTVNGERVWLCPTHVAATKALRGFASMSAEKQRAIAAKGGAAAHARGTAHEWSTEEARRAGRVGGMMSRGGRGKVASA